MPLPQSARVTGNQEVQQMLSLSPSLASEARQLISAAAAVGFFLLHAVKNDHFPSSRATKLVGFFFFFGVPTNTSLMFLTQH